MELLFTPDLVGRTTTALVLVAGLVYLLRLKRKSADTWRMVAYIGLIVLADLIVLSVELTSGVHLMSGEGALQAPVAHSIWLAATLCGYLTWVLVAYTIRFRLSRIEEKLALFVFSTLFVAGFAWYLMPIFQGSQAFATSPILLVALNFLAVCWSVVVLGRKVFIALRGNHPPESRGMVLLLFIASILALFGSGSNIGNVFSFIPAEFQGAVSMVSFLVTAALVFLAILLFGDERHSVLAKLIAFLLIIYTIVLSFTVAAVYPPIRSTQDFQGLMPAHSLLFEPGENGTYTMKREAAKWTVSSASPLKAADDGAVRSEIPFSFPFYGAHYDTLFAGTNGYISFRNSLDEQTGFLVGDNFFREVPSIAPMYADFVMADPGAGIVLDKSPDSLVVTFQRLSAFGAAELIVDTQVILFADGRVLLNYKDMRTRPFRYFAGISPGGPQRPVDLNDDAFVSRANQAIYEAHDDRMAYIQFVRPRATTLAWVAFLGLLVIGGIGILFYRVGLVRPLTKVLSGMKEVEQGELNAEVHIAERNELGALADHFNSMTHSLRTYSGQMEDLVAERTESLNATVENLKATQAQLIQQEKMASLGQLTAGIAHEIKNPLNFINNFAELNEELAEELRADLAEFPDALAHIGDLLSDMKSNAAIIAEHGMRADGIVRGMMEHASGGNGTRTLTEVNPFVAEYIDLAYHGRCAQVAGFTAAVERDLDETAGVIEMVTQDFGRVLLNLLGNAFDAVHECAASEGEGFVPTVRVSTRRTTDSLEIRVSDNGTGIPPAIASKIFEPFFTTKPTGSGTGLGLSLSYDIVTQGHGGTLKVESEPGEGATFVVALPTG